MSLVPSLLGRWGIGAVRGPKIELSAPSVGPGVSCGRAGFRSRRPRVVAALA